MCVMIVLCVTVIPCPSVLDKIATSDHMAELKACFRILTVLKEHDGALDLLKEEAAREEVEGRRNRLVRAANMLKQGKH